MFLFSFVLIARNEEKTLPRFLESIKYFLDNWWECIIVDTWSTDNTVQIARKLWAKVFEEWERFRITIDEKKAQEINNHFIIQWEEPVVKTGQYLFDFASARNYASFLSTNDFIFSPDCDEIWTNFNYEQINFFIKEWIEQFEYQFVFSHDEYWNPAIQFIHSKAFDRRKLQWKWIIHEILQWDANRRYVWEDILKLEHYQNHETNRSSYLKGLAVDCYEHPESDRNSHYLGRELLWTWRPQSAIKELTRHIEMNKWPAERAQSHIYIGDAYEELWQNDSALESYFKAYMIEWNMREPLIKISEYYFKNNDWIRTITFCEAMLHIKQGGFYASQTENYTYKPHQMLYVAYWHIWDKEKSTYHFWKAYNYSPFHSKHLYDIRFYKELPKISILIPTLRQEWLERLKISIDNLNYPKELIEVLIQEDSPIVWVPKRIKELFERSTWEYIVYAADDMEFYPDSIIIALLEDKDLVSFNSWELYQDKWNICEHFIIKKEFVINHLNNEIFDIELQHAWVDNLLWAKANKYGTAKWCNEAKIIHHHFSKTWIMDEVYTKAYENVEHDRQILANKLLTI